MSVRALLDPVACHARLACSLSLGAAHKSLAALADYNRPERELLARAVS